MKNATTKKTSQRELLRSFSDRLEQLLAEYPEVRLSSDEDGDVTAYCHNTDTGAFERIYLPVGARRYPLQ